MFILIGVLKEIKNHEYHFEMVKRMKPGSNRVMHLIAFGGCYNIWLYGCICIMWYNCNFS